MPRKEKQLWQTLFALYGIVMLSLLFGRRESGDALPYLDQVSMRLNLIPLRTLSHQLRLLTQSGRPWLVRHAAVNLVGNVLLFLPLGLLLPKLFHGLDRLWKTLSVTGGIILLVELTQVLTLLGRCDIDDLILNLLGAAMGYGLYRRFFQE